MANGRNDPPAVCTLMRACVSPAGAVRSPARGPLAYVGQSSRPDGQARVGISRSGGAPLVPMVQAADLGQLDHLTGLWWRDRARVRRVLHEGQMGYRQSNAQGPLSTPPSGQVPKVIFGFEQTGSAKAAGPPAHVSEGPLPPTKAISAPLAES
jgi:hypothetical protein